MLAFNISDHPTVAFAIKPLQEALNKVAGRSYRTTVHTDQGFQYQNTAWRKVLKQHRAFQSMSRKATCLDNATMESFFHIMKAELFDQAYPTKAALVLAMTDWLDYYNQRRIKIKLKGRSPVQYRQSTSQSVA
ncbi:transposase [Furfurilactobacillus curtus]